MTSNLKINYIELPAENLDKVEKFYGQAFGWTFVSYGADYLAFSDGVMDGGFYRAPLASNAANGSALVVLYADDLESAETRVVKSGGQISTPIFSFPGGRRFHFKDPNQNELAVWSDH